MKMPAIRCLILLGALLPAIAGTCRAADDRHPHASGTTIAERIRKSPLNQIAQQDCIVFPHTGSGWLMLGPAIVEAGKPLTRHPDADRVVWDSCPRNDRHVEYLARRREFLRKGEYQALVNWCLRNELPVAAEFELRGVLRRIWDFRQPEYQRFRKQWLRLADKRRVAYTFPLPVEGEWSVLRDQTGHHRIKHGAAHAFDLVIMKNGKPFRRRGRELADHYSWGKPILAQADGVVSQAQDQNPDAPIGRPGKFANANHVQIYYGAGFSGFYGHIQQGSLRVRVGQKVAKGEILALVGNSGASGIPHLHFTMVDQSGFSVRGRFSFERKKNGRWRRVNGKRLPESASVRDWSPSLP